MRPGDPPPEIPPPTVPGQPERPAHPDPTVPPQIPAVPLVDPEPPDDPVRHLLADRRLLLMGPLDRVTADHVCAELMHADGLAADPVELIINSPGGPTEAVIGMLDVIGLLRAPLATRCVGGAVGTATLVLASGTAGRSIGANATISLRLAGDHRLDGSADAIVSGAGAIADAVDRLARHVARVSHLTVEEAAAALRDGGHLSASDAVAVGLADEVTGR